VNFNKNAGFKVRGYVLLASKGEKLKYILFQQDFP